MPKTATPAVQHKPQVRQPLYLEALAILLRDQPDAYDTRVGVGYYAPAQVRLVASQLWQQICKETGMQDDECRMLPRNVVTMGLQRLAARGRLWQVEVANASTVSHGTAGYRYRLPYAGETAGEILSAYLAEHDNHLAAETPGQRAQLVAFHRVGTTSPTTGKVRKTVQMRASTRDLMRAAQMRANIKTSEFVDEAVRAYAEQLLATKVQPDRGRAMLPRLSHPQAAATQQSQLA